MLTKADIARAAAKLEEANAPPATCRTCGREYYLMVKRDDGEWGPVSTSAEECVTCEKKTRERS